MVMLTNRPPQVFIPPEDDDFVLPDGNHLERAALALLEHYRAGVELKAVEACAVD
jgi:hypothetical protein